MAVDERLIPYVKIDGFSSVQPGNSGQYFYLARAEGLWQIFRSEFTNNWGHQITFFSEGVASFSVSPDGRLIAVEINEKGSEHNPVGLVDSRTGAFEIIIHKPGAMSQNFLWHPRAEFFFFRSNFENGTDFKIYSYHIRGRALEKVVDGIGWCYPIDFSRCGKYLLYGVAHSNTDNDLYLFELGTSHPPRHVTPHQKETVFEAVFGTSPDQIFLLDNSQSDFKRLYDWNLKTGEKRPFGEDIPWELEGLRISANRRYLAYLANVHGYSHLHLVDAMTGFRQPAPETGGVISDMAFDQKDNLFLAYQYPKRPSQIYYWNLHGRMLKQMTWAVFYGLNPHDFADPHLIEYTSFDGLKIPAFLFLPRNYKRGRAIPMYLHFHGGPESQFTPSFYKHFQFFLAQGIGICAPNIRGSSGYGSDYMALDDYKKRMDSVKDGIALAHHLFHEGYTTREQLGVVGGSYGGYMVLSLISEAPDLFAAAVDVVGIANLVSFLKNTKSYRRALREKEYGPLSDEEFLKSISPIYKIHHTETPLLIIHGATDPRVPLDEAQQVERILRQQNKPVEMLVFEDEGHGIKKTANALIYYQRMWEFFQKYLIKSEPREDSHGG